VNKFILDDYLAIIREFAEGRMDSRTFVEIYLNKFKNEKEIVGGRLYDEMQALFSDANSVTDDEGLIRENPDFYISEKDFKEKIPGYLSRIALLGMNR